MTFSSGSARFVGAKVDTIAGGVSAEAPVETEERGASK
jgi:hypothetical protein